MLPFLRESSQWGFNVSGFQMFDFDGDDDSADDSDQCQQPVHLVDTGRKANRCVAHGTSAYINLL